MPNILLAENVEHKPPSQDVRKSVPVCEVLRPQVVVSEQTAVFTPTREVHIYDAEDGVNGPVEAKPCHDSDVMRNCQIGGSSTPLVEQKCELGLENSGCKPSEKKRLPRPPIEIVIALRSPGNVGSSCGDLSQDGSSAQKPSKTPVKSSKKVGSSSKSNVASGQQPSKTPVKSSKKVGRPSKSNAACGRALRPRYQGKTNEPVSNNDMANAKSVGVGEEKKKKKKKTTRVEKNDDEYSRIRKHLRYLLNRISYEQSLIAAYSAEGWKGMSLEKLKPEKELQRAMNEIFRRKLKIRDLFQSLETLCAQGKFPESLFDSEGQIDSEDIFCAKCGRDDLPSDNDIILCDGPCDRGFHQLCLEPPLLKEDIPPDDESWLCPGCDCKDYCVDLLNESLETELCVTDSWEKVFPEAAAAAAAGHDLDPNSMLPSDDSDDNDYEPDDPATAEKDQEGESGSDKSSSDESDSDGSGSDESGSDKSSSDEPDYTCESDKPDVQANCEKSMGLSSDDSEDEEFDPDAPDLDEDINQESSGTDFSSDSEDLSAILEDCKASRKDEVPISVSLPGDQSGKKYRFRGKKQSLNCEFSSTVQSETGQDGSSVISAKRIIERLDYKNLYEETYADVPSSSSDDEDWSDTTPARQRRKTTKEFPSAKIDGNITPTKNGKGSKASIQTAKETESTVEEKHQQNSKLECNGNTSQSKLEKQSLEPGSSSQLGSSAFKRLGEAVTKRLNEAFNVNQYPSRATKESLAKELEIAYKQVHKWFDNTRWSFNHPSTTRSRGTKDGKPREGKSTTAATCTDEILETGTTDNIETEKDPNAATQKAKRCKSVAPKRKRKRR